MDIMMMSNLNMNYQEQVVCDTSSQMHNGANTNLMKPPPSPSQKLKSPFVTNEVSSLSAELEFDGTTVLCRVCGDKASGFHYGVHSCEGCKGFFRRSIQQKIQYRPCTKNQQCSILRINRNRCQYCRLKKCIAVGMSRDAVRFGRVPKREKARILAAMNQCTQIKGQEKLLTSELEDQPRLTAAVLDAHLRTCEFTNEKVSSMRQKARDSPSYSLPTLACPLNPAAELQSEQEFSQRFAHVIRGVIDFAGLIPGFQLLSQDDKFTLLKGGLFDALFVRLICMFDTQINSIICLNGQIMRRDTIQNGANARFLVDSTFNFAERINSMCLSDTEIALFCAIVLITPDRPGLRNVELVEKMYSRLKQCLQLVIMQHRPDKPEFMKDLLMLLPDLRTLSTLHTEKLVVFRTEHKELLRQQGGASNGCPHAAAANLVDGGSEAEAQPQHKGQFHVKFENLNVTEPRDGLNISRLSANEKDQYFKVNISKTPTIITTTKSPLGECPFRQRASSGSSAEEDLVGTTHLVQNGLTITPVSRSNIFHGNISNNTTSTTTTTAATTTSNKYRKLDSPTDSGIESGNEKHDLKYRSSCSPSRSSVEDFGAEERRKTYEDMPVLKRVLQAPPLYDTSSLMDEAYKPHKKFRAMRQRDIDEVRPHFVSSDNSSLLMSRSQSQLHLIRPVMHQQSSGPQSHPGQQHPQQHQQPQPPQVPLSATYSLLAKSLKEEPRMTAEQLKRTDIIQNYIMREKQADHKRVISAEMKLSDELSVTVDNHHHQQSPHHYQQQQHLHHLHKSKSQQFINEAPSSSPSSASPLISLTSVSPAAPASATKVIARSLSSSSASQISSYSSSSSSSSSCNIESPPLIELQLGIADHQPLNLSKKSPSPPPTRFINSRHVLLET